MQEADQKIIWNAHDRSYVLCPSNSMGDQNHFIKLWGWVSKPMSKHKRAGTEEANVFLPKSVRKWVKNSKHSV